MANKLWAVIERVGTSRVVLGSQGFELGMCRVEDGQLVTASVSGDASERCRVGWSIGTTGSAWPVSSFHCRGSGCVRAGGSFSRMDAF